MSTRKNCHPSQLEITRRAAVGVALCAVGSVLSPKILYASEDVNNTDGVVVPLLTLNVHLPYMESGVFAQRELLDNGSRVRVLIIDAASGCEIECLEEAISSPLKGARLLRDGSLRPAASSNYNTELSRTVTLAKPNGVSVRSRVWTEVNVTAGQSWGQIERVNACGQRSGSGNYQLEATHTYSSTTTFPTNTVVIGYSGNVLITNSNSLGISYSGVLNSGFTLSGSATATWYARKSYNSKVSISLR